MWRVLAAALTLVAVLGALAVSLSRAWRKTKGAEDCRQLPPGPGRSLPMLGDLLLLQGKTRLEEKLLHLSRKHGPLMWLQMGSIPTVIVNSPDMARPVLKEQDKLFSHRRKETPSYAISNLLYYGDAFYDPHGHAWKFLVKKQMFMEFLTEKQMQKYLPIREREFGKVIAFIREMSLCGSTPPVINLAAPVTAALVNAATQTCCSKSYCDIPEFVGADKPDLACMLQTTEDWMRTAYWLVGETTDLMTKVFIGDVLPAFSFLDRLLNRSTRKQIHDNFSHLDTFFQGLVDQRRSQPPVHKLPQEQDMLDSLLAWRDDNGKPLSDTTIKGGFQFAVIGLTESLATSMEWTLALLLAHPEHLAQLYEEMDQVIGRERLVQESDLDRLPFLRAVIKEAWRLHPPAPLSPPHSNPVETEIAGFHIPARTNVLVNFYGIGRDAAVWPHPDEFMPQRFMEEAARHIEANGQHMELLVFGSGKRQCLGIKLAPRIQGLLLARLLHAFDLRASPDHPIRLCARSVGLSHKIQGPLMAIPSPRLSPRLYSC